MKNKKIRFTVIGAIAVAVLVASYFSVEYFKYADYIIEVNGEELTLNNVERSSTLDLISSDIKSTTNSLSSEYKLVFTEETKITEFDTKISYEIITSDDKQIDNIKTDELKEYKLNSVKSIKSVVTITAEKTEITEVPFAEQVNEDPNAYVGVEAIITPGVNGTETKVTTITYVNGKDVTDEKDITVTVVEPTQQVRNIGTLPVPVSSVGGSSSGATSGGSRPTGGGTFSNGGASGQYSNLNSCEVAGNRWLINGGNDGYGSGTWMCVPSPAGDYTYDLVTI